ncbi:MAG: UrcA family protein [Erythrobacter sp.]|nr:UrcA family protein [Erythrobacter sp.]
MKKFAKSLTLALAGLAMAGAAISPALAAGPADPMTLKIATADINLATAQGQRTLDRRIEKAARSVCRADDRSTGTRIMNQDARTCLDKVRAEARQQVAALNRIEQRGA